MLRSALVASCMLIGAEAFMSGGLPMASSTTRGAATCRMSADNGMDASAMSRRQALGLTPAVLAALSLATSPIAADALPVPAALENPQLTGSVDVDGYLQHAVITCRDLDEEVEFWTKGLGMRVLRSRTVKGVTTKFVGFGPETLKSDKGGHFSLEITEGPKKYDIGTGFQRFEFNLPVLDPILAATNLILNLEDAGGSLIPRWFGASNFVEVASPSGWTARINPVKEAKVPYPFKGIVLRTSEISESLVFWESLGMSKQKGGFMPFMGDGSEVLRFETEGGVGVGPTLVLEPAPKDGPAVRVGDAFKVAVVSQDWKKTRDAAKKEGDAKVLFEGKAPGTETSIALMEEPSTGYQVAIVSANGFEKEIPKAPQAPAPAPPQAPAEAPAPVVEKKKRPRFGETPMK